MRKIGIIGGGAWGTALAAIANRAGADVVMWTRNKFVRESIRKRNQNDQYLPGVFLDPAIEVTENLPDPCGADMVLMVVPSQYMRSTCISMSDYLDQKVPVVICAKGIERGSLSLMHEVVQSVLPHNPVAVLSGPNFANEAAKGLPTATTVACEDARIGEQIVFSLGTSLFRPYLNNDLIGTQIGGATKNVIAIACGIAMGKGLGENARAALISRAISEMRRLCIAKGGRDDTLMGLSGVGDLVLTCTGHQSRNLSFGIALGEGREMESILGGREGVVEGVTTSESIRQLAEQLGIDMPICSAVYDVLYSDADIDQMIHQLLDRPFSPEDYKS